MAGTLLAKLMWAENASIAKGETESRLQFNANTDKKSFHYFCCDLTTKKIIIASEIL